MTPKTSFQQAMTPKTYEIYNKPNKLPLKRSSALSELPVRLKETRSYIPEASESPYLGPTTIFPLSNTKVIIPKPSNTSADTIGGRRSEKTL